MSYYCVSSNQQFVNESASTVSQQFVNESASTVSQQFVNESASTISQQFVNESASTLREKAEDLLAKVQPLSEAVESTVAKGDWETKALSDMVKKVHLCNVELMHVLEDLADISLVHLKDSEELRRKRKAIVDRIVAKQNLLDAVIVSGHKALGK
ncbi:BAG domain [Trinorchestia longiramus]|nr:BAG domain [Trinorchestia longiramus]